MENYSIHGKLGEGSFGEVLLAVDRRIGEDGEGDGAPPRGGLQVALKRIFVRHPDGGIPVGVWREIKSLQHIEHENVVAVRVSPPFPRSLPWIPLGRGGSHWESSMDPHLPWIPPLSSMDPPPSSIDPPPLFHGSPPSLPWIPLLLPIPRWPPG